MQPVNLGTMFDSALTREQWWTEYDANRCCPDAATAARRLCGCGGSDRAPVGISCLL